MVGKRASVSSAKIVDIFLGLLVCSKFCMMTGTGLREVCQKMKKGLIVALSLSFLCCACARVQYNVLKGQEDLKSESNAPGRYKSFNPSPSKIHPPSASKTQTIGRYRFKLNVSPDPPRAQKEVDIDLTVQDVHTGEPVMDLDARCRGIMQEQMFITRCDTPHQKDSLGHYPLSVVYSMAGDWTLRFDIKTPEGKILKPAFTITVE